ncbi:MULTISPECIES: hypothetical protein [unclassified Leptolyngbya]|uniref:hypothetical protein n=1 Tax=unclassified Leptolyngbya TaxID=2650499 RepID=UPI0016863BCD|nr:MULTISPECIES: hypothetical protein [unclassified Leptolyngbya]MBD1913490.1 hypothetical protein [Leptolyngbya sp. FACHB-8]MBD2154884.1 hypothetical protein [Leptolyngbya sp. FACHB-16]
MATFRPTFRAIAIYISLAFLGFMLAVGLSWAFQVATAPKQPPQVNAKIAMPPEVDHFRDGVNQAMQAAQQTQAATTPEQWTQVVELWEGAIASMQNVPLNNEKYATAQQKAEEYEKNLAYARRNSGFVAASPKEEQSPEDASDLSKKAALLQIGMTYDDVIELLGRRPDTYADDAIRQELGRPVSGVSLLSFDWTNDDPDCYPISVEFDPETMTVTGWDEGTACFGASGNNRPFGKPCAGAEVCRP